MTDIIRALREFGKMMPEGGAADPMIETMSGLAIHAAEEIMRLRAALEPFARVARRSMKLPVFGHTPEDFTEVLSELSEEEDARARASFSLPPTPRGQRRSQTQFVLDSLRIKHWLAAQDALDATGKDPQP